MKKWVYLFMFLSDHPVLFSILIAIGLILLILIISLSDDDVKGTSKEGMKDSDPLVTEYEKLRKMCLTPMTRWKRIGELYAINPRTSEGVKLKTAMMNSIAAENEAFNFWLVNQPSEIRPKLLEFFNKGEETTLFTEESLNTFYSKMHADQ